jgi:hypothetical protein
MRVSKTKHPGQPLGEIPAGTVVQMLSRTGEVQPGIFLVVDDPYSDRGGISLVNLSTGELVTESSTHPARERADAALIFEATP